MLPKSKRLNLKTDFKWIVSGKKSEDSFLKLFIRTGDPSTALRTGPRVGIALSSKNFKLATERNRARRLTAKAFEGLIDKLPKNINIVAMPKQEILKLSSEEVEKRLEDLLDK